MTAPFYDIMFVFLFVILGYTQINLFIVKKQLIQLHKEIDLLREVN